MSTGPNAPPHVTVSVGHTANPTAVAEFLLALSGHYALLANDILRLDELLELPHGVVQVSLSGRNASAWSANAAKLGDHLSAAVSELGRRLSWSDTPSDIPPCADAHERVEHRINLLVEHFQQSERLAVYRHRAEADGLQHLVQAASDAVQQMEPGTRLVFVSGGDLGFGLLFG